jgi:hypothetical protein
MEVRFSVCTATLYHQKDILLLISVRGKVNPTGIVRLEGLDKLKKKTIQ